MKNMIIYKVTNLINQKIYIGLTTKSLQERWQQHINSAKTKQDNFYFHKALRKYGVENFQIEEIDTANSIEELKQKEIYYISLYHSCIYDSNYCNGYNMTFGGDLNFHLKGENSPCSKNSDEQRWKVILLLKNTSLTFLEIAQICQLQGNAVEKTVDMINRGENFHQNDIDYPIRKNAKSISKIGKNNPVANNKIAEQIVDMLINTNLSQTKIAQILGVHYNTVNDINCCKRWTELHCYHRNIREECGKGSYSLEQKNRVLQIIHMLEQNKTNKEIIQQTKTSANYIADINLCRKFTDLHSYKQNIRKESKKEGDNDVYE